MTSSKKTEWRSCSLGEMLTFQRGFDINKKQQVSGDYDVISSSGSIYTHNCYKSIGPGVIVGRKGTLGTVFYSDGNFWPHATALWVKDFHGNDPKFAYYFVQTLKLERYDSGAANPTLNRNHIHTLQVRVPPLPTQKKVAGIITAYDDLIENNNRRIKILEEMARSIYREWFVNYRFPGHENVKMVCSELGEIPETWEVLALKDVCTRITDGSHSSPASAEEGYPMASVKDMTDWGLDESTCRTINQDDYDKLVTNNCKPLLNDILIAKDGSYLKHAFVVDEEKELVVLSSIAILRPNTDAIFPQLLCQSLRQPHTKARLAGYVSGVAIPRIILKDFANFPVVVPPMKVQQRYSDVSAVCVEMIRKTMRQNANLRQTRDLLLPKLISGELDVEELDIAVA